MHSDFLFYPFFPRELGVPHSQFFQRRTYTSTEFFDEIERKRKEQRELYAGIYAIDNGTVTVDRIAFDIDAPSLFTAKKIAVKLCSILNNLDLQPVIVFSGRKGFHVYVFFSPKQLSEAFAKCITRLLCLDLTKDVEFVDPHFHGNVRGMLRVPNTLHSLRHYAIPLTQEELVRYDMLGIMRMSRTVRDIDEIVRDEGTVIDIADEVQISHQQEQQRKFSVHTDEVGEVDIDIIREFVRECVIEKLLSDPEPPHLLRVDFVSELMIAGFSEEDVVRIFTRYFSFWDDFDIERTRYQIHHIFQHKYLPLSCSKLRRYVRCKRCGNGYLWR